MVVNSLLKTYVTKFLCRLVIILSFSVWIFFFSIVSVPGVERIYPIGKKFPLGLYSVHTVEGLNNVKRFGWNMVHKYNFKSKHLQLCEKTGMLTMASLEDQPNNISEDRASIVIKDWSKYNSLAWWDLPEERRWWIKDEMALIMNYCKWTRLYDNKKRPTYMYIPAHYNASSVSKYVPFLDIIPAAVYTTYCQMPHAWVRWRMETTIEGIKLGNAIIGRNYLNGEKTPVAILELFYRVRKNGKRPKIMTEEGAYHDFWQSIVSGARGVLIFSHWHKRDHPQYEKNMNAYSNAALQINGTERIGEAVLFGKRLDTLRCKTITGPAFTKSFIPQGTSLKPVTFPSINQLTIDYRDNIYVIIVNSAESTVTASLSGLPKHMSGAAVLFKNRNINITHGKLTLTLPPLGVRILKM